MAKNLFKRAMSMMTCAAVAVSAAASVVSVSPSMNVSAANADTSDYAKALQYSLYFFDANMCGDQVGETSHVTWRDDCHTYADVKGGFHDAGDHVMFGLAQGYTSSTIGWAYYEYSDAFEELGLVTHYKTINDYFCQFYKDSTQLSGSTVSRFMYQNGNGDTDHAYWLAPENQTQSQWGSSMWTTSDAANIAAQYAATLALSYMNFGNEEDLTYAKALFTYANNNRSNYSCGQYSSESCTDDICWAAGWLYIATGDNTYKNVFNSLVPNAIYWGYCWNNMALGNAILNGYINNNWSTANSYISSKCNSNSYWVLDGWGSARYNAAMQLCALVISKHTSYDYTNWVKWQMTYLLGGNGAKACFLTGLGDNSAKYAHHRAASGYDSNAEFTGKTGYASDGHTLIGALVGGPSDANGTYNDTIQDYNCNEVALDYNAGMVGALAGLYDLYGTGSVVTYINDETEVCLDGSTPAPVEYAIGVENTNCYVSLSSETATEGTTVSFTTTPSINNAEGPEVSIVTSSGTSVSYSGSNGSYSFTMPADSVVIKVSYTQAVQVVYGDVNNDGIVDAIDATMATRYAVGRLILDADALTRGDVNQDGIVDAIDATIITRYSVGRLASLPV